MYTICITYIILSKRGGLKPLNFPWICGCLNANTMILITSYYFTIFFFLGGGFVIFVRPLLNICIISDEILLSSFFNVFVYIKNIALAHLSSNRKLKPIATD